MRIFLQFISYLFHPILIPIAGTLAYFLITPRFSPDEFQSGNILPIFILTVVIPIISFLILKNLGLVSSISLIEIKERKYPYYINIALLFMIIYKVIPNNFTAELYYFFIGLIAATFTSLLLLFLNFKSSMHLMGMGSLFMFLVSLSVHFEINIIIALSLFILATGLVATSRLYLRAHQKSEVIFGFLIGFFSQLLTIKFWL
jgi:membrane-associated phospholipid phosphatase